ncbi:MAG: hypothetical protein AB7T59_14325 [Hyphomonadaceae bacterium]
MDLQSIAAIAEMLAAIGVLLSLIFVGLQIRQNTQAQRVLAVETLSAAITAINVPAMESPVLGAAVSKVCANWYDSTREERIVAHYFLFSIFKLLETAWYQQKAGTLDPAHWAGWEQLMLMLYHSPGIQSVWWPLRRHAYSPEFQAYLATSRPSADIAPLSKLFDAPINAPSPPHSAGAM